MPKHFQKLPAEFEAYNPELIEVDNLFYYETHDENGKLHSFDDKPAQVYSHLGFCKIFWYHHGIIFRPDNKPYGLTVSKETYATLDQNQKLHSYNGMPSMINKYDFTDDSYSFDWQEHGVPHREEDFPASVIWNEGQIGRIRYTKHGQDHRENGLPAFIGPRDKRWFIRGQLHNADTTAYYEARDYESYEEVFKYGLYGVMIPKELFEKIKAYAGSKQVPLWVSFLRNFELITDEAAQSLSTGFASLDRSVPLAWLLRGFGITHDNFTSSINQTYKTNASFGFYKRRKTSEAHLQSFADVVEFEETEKRNKL